MKKERHPEVHFYEWSVSRWLSSDSRAELNLAERGLYRECLDLCYTNGSIPKDPAVLARLCHCTPAEIEAVWPKIERHFHTVRNDKTRAENTSANMFRRTFFRYKRSQKQIGKRGGRPKVNRINDEERVPFSTSKPKLSEAKLSEAKTKRSEEEGFVKAAASGSPPASPAIPSEPPARMPSSEEIETIRVWLQEAAGPRAPLMEPPDDPICCSIFAACRCSMDLVRQMLIGLARAKRLPQNSWAFYLRIACDRFARPN